MKNFKFTWAHGVVAALGSFILFILYLIFVFSHGQQNSELVSDNYYEDELAYQSVIDAKKNASTIENAPKYQQTPYGISIVFPSENNNQNTKIKFVLYRIDDQKLDVKKDMTLDANNSFLIPKKVLVPGGYILKLMWTKDNKDYQIDYDLVWK
ncbi:FixH family protein [Riemerella anatipestifer]|uniref:FixH family protein n=1 Tax=Riemerella anatipestifer TaxID=34085 RepID=UPI0007ED98D6|nr:FixH family protein [Riemerella anatipestifer]MBT0552109.1 FixH family protein [Riemerella anatipestifer]MBT0554410.1 FixH family protein [Riemerella anatipestifer]MCE3025225.1 FixH family protein [Riemerella anatipestifer]MCU7543317.1 FixH family protein [Riemerella anatipestifer]MCU7560113.1 FixH family protein [Riemerella anatipestifer]